MWGSMCMRPCMDALKYVQVIVGWQIPRDTISFLLILKLPKSNTLVGVVHVWSSMYKSYTFFSSFLFCTKSLISRLFQKRLLCAGVCVNSLQFASLQFLFQFLMYTVCTVQCPSLLQLRGGMWCVLYCSWCRQLPFENAVHMLELYCMHEFYFYRSSQVLLKCKFFLLLSSLVW